MKESMTEEARDLLRYMEERKIPAFEAICILEVCKHHILEIVTSKGRTHVKTDKRTIPSRPERG